MFRMLCKGTTGEVLSLLLFPSQGFGASGDVGVLARSHLGRCSMRYGEGFAWNHEVEPGRVVEAFLPGSGGIVLYSVYLHDGEGFDERNRGILHLVGEKDSDASVAGDRCW